MKINDPFVLISTLFVEKSFYFDGNLRCSEMQKTPDHELMAWEKWALHFETRSAYRLYNFIQSVFCDLVRAQNHIALSILVCLADTLPKQWHKTTLETFYVITRSWNIFGSLWNCGSLLNNYETNYYKSFSAKIVFRNDKLQNFFVILVEFKQKCHKLPRLIVDLEILQNHKCYI